MSTKIILKVKEKGHLIEIPGVPPFRTPAKINVTNADIRNIIGYLKACGIDSYEVIASTEKGTKEIYTEQDFELPKKESKPIDELAYKNQIDKRFNRLEKMIATLASKKTSNLGNNKEQITNKLENLELIAKRILDEAVVREVVYTKTPGRIIKEDDIEELEDAYIPEVDISDMKIVSSSVEILKQDSDNIEDSVDKLSNLTGKKRR